MEKKEIIKLSWEDVQKSPGLSLLFLKEILIQHIINVHYHLSPGEAEGEKGEGGLDSKPVWARQQDLPSKNHFLIKRERLFRTHSNSHQNVGSWKALGPLST